MRDRRLSPEERAVWARVAATVRPIGRPSAIVAPPPPAEPDVAAPAPRPAPARAGAAKVAIAASPRALPGETLDGGWDRRLARGLVAPDRTIDLHGHTLASAHATLDQALARAITDGARLLLVVTGRPPRRGDIEPRRGLIRASIGDWLAASPHAARLAAIRHAHPRHGGAGAIYLVLRRKR